MAEYIERETLIQKYRSEIEKMREYAINTPNGDDGNVLECRGELTGMRMALKFIQRYPAADVVEVVRCGQCFYSAHEGELWICVHPDQYCDCGAKIVDPGYFCGYGRRIGVVDENSDT